MGGDVVGRAYEANIFVECNVHVCVAVGGVESRVGQNT